MVRLGLAFVRDSNRWWLDTGDVPMSRVKMNAKHEYEFLANYKIMQNVFKAKKIDKVRWSPRRANHGCFSTALAADSR